MTAARPTTDAIRRAALLDERAAQRAREEENQRRSAFLNEAGPLLASSLDYETTLASVARLVVPHLADWCTIDLFGDDGVLRPLAVAHVDPAKVELAHELQRRLPPDPGAPHGPWQVIRTSQSELMPEIPADVLVAATQDADLLRILRELGLTSSMCVPMIARDQTLGAITFVAAESGRRYGPDDLAMAEELARRAALHVDNARLYREARRAEEQLRALNEQLEQRVAERTAQLEATLLDRDAQIAERKRAQAEIERLNDDLVRRAGELTAANTELEAFSYSVSHDLRAPLRAIDGFSRLVLDEYAPQLPPEAQRYLGRVRENAQQMGALIDDLLAFSRLSRQPLVTQRVAPAIVARQVLDELRREYQGRRVEVTVGELPVCQADPALLKQVFANLLANAVKFTAQREVARITIGSRAGDGEHLYYVQDNGVGFDMRYAHKLFGVFQRLHRAEEYAGTGVGLAIVQRIIHRHGGRVWAEAEVATGATFFFTLKGEPVS